MAKESSDLVVLGENDLDASMEKEIVVSTFDQIVKSTITEAQFLIISGRTPKSVIKKRPGKGGKVFSYVPHGYVVAVLNRAFGFNWDFETVPQNNEMFKVLPLVMGPDKNGKEVVYRNPSVLVHGKLTVRIIDPTDARVTLATIVKTATGEKEATRGMSWGGLVKSAESDALKKAASKLGVALDLYWQDADSDYIPSAPKTPEELHIIELRENGMSPIEIAQTLDNITVKEVAQALKE